MHSEIKVSICCITYNHENYIRQAIDSFMMQKTNFKFEILIHDDASTDRTPEIIREYEEKYPDVIKPIYQKENQTSKGIKISRTYQYPRAKGEYIAWCEGDDFWTDENKLQMQIDFLDNNPQYVACVHRYITVNESGEKTNIRTFGYYEDEGIYTLQDFQAKELPSQLATYVSRNILCKEGCAYPNSFDLIKMQGDIKLSLYLLAQGDIYRLPNICSAYRFVCKAGGNSWSSRQLRNPYRPYNQWKALRELEKVFYQEYDKKISLKKRRVASSLEVLKAIFIKFNFKTIGHALHVIIAQRGLFCAICKLFFRKMKEKNNG